MAIETLQDILTELGDQLGIYGAHPEEGHDERKPCRMCFESDLRERILAAIEIERKLYPFRVCEVGRGEGEGMSESDIQRKIRLCALALFEARLLSKMAELDAVKEVLKKYFERKR